jgi:hypothetical protein
MDEAETPSNGSGQRLVMVRLELYIFDDGMVAMGVSIWW